MPIIIFGDSHVNLFCRNANIPDLYPPNIHENGIFKAIRCGAPLAYSLGNYDTYYNARKKLEFVIKTVAIQRATLLLSFGEIDCRYHIMTQAKRQLTHPDNIITNVINNYITAIKEITKECKSYKINAFVLGPVATTWMEECNSSRDCPICGTMIDRNIVTDKFNMVLEDKCKNSDIGYISIFSHLINSKYETIRKYYRDDCIHLNINAFRLMSGELKRKGIINGDENI